MADIEKPSNLEDEYFAKEDVEKKRRMAQEQSKAMAEKQREEVKKLHYMKCPKCGMDLHTISRGSVDLDTCFNCHGTWFDAGELEQILASRDHQPGHVIRAVLNMFGHK